VHIAPAVNIPDTITCADSIVLSVPQNPVYFYNWSNGSTNYQSTYTQAGLHWVEYGDTCGNSLVTDTFQLTLGFSTLSLGNDTTLCAGDSLVLQTHINFANHLWQDGSSSPTFVVKQAGVYWVEVDFGPCFGADTIIVNYDNTIPFILGSDTAFCYGDSILLDASSSLANAFLWNTGETTSSIWAAQSGVYSVTAGTSLCSQSSSINIEVFLDNVKFAKDTLLCNGQNAILWANGGDSYLWNTGETNDTLVVSPNASANYSVVVTEDNCSVEHFFQVNVTDKIAIADFIYDINSCKGSVCFTNQSTNATTYFWDFGDGNTSNLENPTHEYAQGGTFTIKLVASKNSCPDTLVKTVQVISLKNIIYFPKAFTPNSDGINDLFEIKGSTECFIEPKLIIQNRWGNEVFHSSLPFSEFWDGRLNGELAPQGVYYYSFYSHNFIEQNQFILIR
jgi:gliding motility-associated-like protein